MVFSRNVEGEGIECRETARKFYRFMKSGAILVKGKAPQERESDWEVSHIWFHPVSSPHKSMNSEGGKVTIQIRAYNCRNQSCDEVAIHPGEVKSEVAYEGEQRR